MNREMRRLQEREERLQKKQGKRRPQRRPQQGQDQVSLLVRVRKFLREVRVELKRVSWPSREQMVAFTSVTVITSAAVTLFVFGLDFIFKEGVLFLLARN
ncbi:MAG TPA: preprotein translocase subunit SecE [Acidimicrobiia bacterium]|jgi:preprotein translocase subunit SecE|nr:preprotein translocase subunit SecE [Acidimicrobiia bacterium]